MKNVLLPFCIQVRFIEMVIQRFHIGMPYIIQKKGSDTKCREVLPGIYAFIMKGGIRMDGPIITVDVSKGNCHYQPFLEKGKPLRKPKILYDTIEGFEELQKSIDLTRQKSEKEVSVIFEATGVYHRWLQKYLDDHDIPYYIISPLLSAKYRQTDRKSVV